MKSLPVTPIEGIPDLEQILEDNPSWLDEPLDEDEAERMSGKTTNAMAVDRSRGQGPDYFKSGRRVIYTRRTILEHRAANRVRLSS